MNKLVLSALLLIVIAAPKCKAMETEDPDLARAIAESLQTTQPQQTDFHADYSEKEALEKALAESTKLEIEQQVKRARAIESSEKELQRTLAKSAREAVKKSELEQQQNPLLKELAEKYNKEKQESSAKLTEVLRKLEHLWSEYPDKYYSELKALATRQAYEKHYTPQEQREIYRIIITPSHVPRNIAALVEKALDHNDAELLDLLHERKFLA